MTRIFWDTMLFIYLFEGNTLFAPRVQELLDRSFNRGDVLLTSHLALGEVLAGARGDVQKAKLIRETIGDFGFAFIPFDDECVSCLLYTSPSPRDRQKSRMPSSA